MLYPVIMCGGSGVRLWPASRPDRPKPFVPFVNGRSIFALTLERLAAIEGAAAPIVVAGALQAGLIRAELDAAGLEGTIVVEPEARDSAPAMAAAAWLTLDADPDGVCLFLAADHHIPDAAAFARVVATAQAAARNGAIVTLGVTPASPSTAYGYIQPGALVGKGPVRHVEAFVEKPNANKAAELIAQGCLWNSGMFIAKAQALISELGVHAPAIASAAKDAVRGAQTEGGVLFLGEGFRRATKLSIDYAVMEQTTQALVAPAEFAWSDLGAWPALLEALPRDEDGNAIVGRAAVDQVGGSLIYAAEGMTVAVKGLSDVAVIAAAGEVMVCAMDQADAVKALVERVQARPAPAPSLADWRDRYQRWFDTGALPLWWALGADHEQGGFREILALDGRPVLAERRMRVQPRQIHVYAQAGLAGWAGPWRGAIEHGLVELRRRYLRPDGLYRTRLALDGSVADETPKLYDQAFMLLALASVYRTGLHKDAASAEALALVRRLRDLLGLTAGGFREHDPRPFQSNPHQHLLEAALAWVEASHSEVAAAPWRALAGEIAGLALSRFIDPDTGALREYFDEDWNPAAGPEGQIVEPGHQFEWAWLLGRWSVIANAPAALAAAKGLYEVGRRGVDPIRRVAIDELAAGRTPVRRTARLWPQTERLKAAVLMAELQPDEAEAFTADAQAAAAALWRYLEGLPPGLFRDRLLPTDAFVDEPAQASSLYHLWGALEALRGL